MLWNAAQWGHTLGIPALKLCCTVLLHSCAYMCASWNARVFYEGISYHHSLLGSYVHGRKCHHEIWQQSSFMSDNVVKNNGNKEAQSHMVMRLYFRAVAASVWNSELFSVVVRQKMSAWTGGCFSQAGSSLVTLASALHLFAADHLSSMDSVNFPPWSLQSTSVLQQWHCKTDCNGHQVLTKLKPCHFCFLLSANFHLK